MSNLLFAIVPNLPKFEYSFNYEEYIKDPSGYLDQFVYHATEEKSFFEMCSDFFTNISNFINDTFDFIVDLRLLIDFVVESITNFIKTLPDLLTIPIEMVGYVPSIVGVCIAFVVSFSVLKLFLGVVK